MPLQFEWQPRAGPVARGEPIGLLIFGDQPTLPAVSNGRVRIVEVVTQGTVGPGGTQVERLIATFHGRFHRDPSAPASERLTFEILRKPSDTAHEGSVFGFDPECMFGVDFFLLTFVNRQFLVWFPFHLDARTGGNLIDLQAVAEITGTGELGRSTIRSLVKREPNTPKTVDTTSTSGTNQQTVTYAGKMVGFNIAVQEDYILDVGVRANPNQTELDPAKLPAPSGAGAIQFAQYTTGTMRIILMTNLLDELAPDQTFVRNQFPAFSNPDVFIDAAKKRIRAAIPPRIVQLFEDAGFQGVTAVWQDDLAAAQLVKAFTANFIDRGARGGNWQLRDATQPLAINFWTYFIAHSGSLKVAARNEAIVSAQNRQIINKREVFLFDNLPIGGGNKRISGPVLISSEIFQKIVTTASTGQFRSYKNLDEFNDATDVMSRKVAATVAHEVAHSLGMMHTARTAAQGNFSEFRGAPVLTVTAEALIGHIGPTVRFSAQAKAIWGTRFGVTPSFTDTSLQNKSWQPNEVATLDWIARKTRYMTTNGETRPVTLPPGLPPTGVPPFAVAPPGTPQRGTK